MQKTVSSLCKIISSTGHNTAMDFLHWGSQTKLNKP